MPIARIDLIKGKAASYRRTIGNTVYRAVVDVLKAPADDRVPVIAEHEAENLVHPASFLGMERFSEQLQLRQKGLFINLAGTGRDGWSIGGGLASLDPRP
jgi:4-oxalocrotonate tautomerase